MPNGHSDNTYNKEWCDERHSRQDELLKELGKSLTTIQTDIATIKTTLAERDKGQSTLWRWLPLALALLAGGGGGVAASKIAQPEPETTTQTVTTPAK